VAEGDSTERSNTPPLTEVILDSLVDGVFTVDRDMRIAYWNRGAEKISGFKAEEAIGRPCCEVFRANLCGGNCPMKLAVETGAPSGPMDVEIVTRDLEEIRVSITTAALRDSDGNFIGGVEAFRELSPGLAPPFAKVADVIESVEGLLSRNPRMKRVLYVIPAVARSDAPMLVCGQTGTGKKLITWAIHRLSSRGSGPFITLSCSTVTEEIRAAEREGRPPSDALASARHRAEGGTFILHEIGDLSPVAQMKLLQLLQGEEPSSPQGEERSKSSTRIVATTSQDLIQAVREGRFREDLFYRLAVVTIDVPSLHERGEDILLLAERFLHRQAKQSGKQVIGLSPEVERLLRAYDFPGNVRELENILEHAIIVCDKPIITVEDLPSYVARTKTPPTTHQAQAHDQEEELSAENVLAALREHAWNKSRAAEALGIHRSTLWRRMKRLKLERALVGVHEHRRE